MGESLCGLEWIRGKNWPRRRTGSPISLVDVFCGCGGLTLGAWEAARRHHRRLEIKLAIDTSDHAICTYRHNFGVTDRTAIQADICEILPGDVGTPPTSIERRFQRKHRHTDLVVGGPPCQGHSDLNNSTRRDDPRNSLYLRMVRMTELLLPKAVIIENVPAVRHDRTGVVDRSLSALSALGYGTSTAILDVSSLGLPQRRKRHLLVAVRKSGFNVTEYIESLQTYSASLWSYIGDIEDESSAHGELYSTPSRMTLPNKKRVDFLFGNELYDLPDEHRPPCHRDKSHSYVSMYGRLRTDRPAQTITSGFGCMGQGRFVHPTRKRTLTPHEAARIQGFPDFFDFSGIDRRTALHDIIGNAVPPKVSALLVDGLIREGIL